MTGRAEQVADVESWELYMWLGNGVRAHAAMMTQMMTHRYCWKNNPKRAELYGRPCRVLARGRMNSVLIELENGQREIVSRRALRKVMSA